MRLAVVCAAALAASGLTLFSGFGLGTLLMPVVALFMPLEAAIAATAAVHLANNLFKAALLGRRADRNVVLRFGVPAVLAALAGAWLLTRMAGLRPLLDYHAFGRDLAVSPAKLIVGGLIAGFVLLELSPRFSKLSIDAKYLPLGGAISGFFGGLSGHQGALRSAFLIKAGLSKESFVASGVLIAVLVDVARMAVYGRDMIRHRETLDWPLVAAASLSAFAGAFLGARILEKATIRTVQRLVAALLLVVAAGLASGLL